MNFTEANLILNKASQLKTGWTKVVGQSGQFSQVVDGIEVVLKFGRNTQYKVQNHCCIPSKTRNFFDITMQLKASVDFGGGYASIFCKTFSGEGQYAKEADYVLAIQKRGQKQFGVAPASK